MTLWINIELGLSRQHVELFHVAPTSKLRKQTANNLHGVSQCHSNRHPTSRRNLNSPAISINASIGQHHVPPSSSFIHLSIKKNQTIQNSCRDGHRCRKKMGWSGIFPTVLYYNRSNILKWSSSFFPLSHRGHRGKKGKWRPCGNAGSPDRHTYRGRGIHVNENGGPSPFRFMGHPRIRSPLGSFLFRDTATPRHRDTATPTHRHRDARVATSRTAEGRLEPPSGI